MDANRKSDDGIALFPLIWLKTEKPCRISQMQQICRVFGIYFAIAALDHIPATPGVAH